MSTVHVHRYTIAENFLKELTTYTRQKINRLSGHQHVHGVTVVRQTAEVGRGREEERSGAGESQGSWPPSISRPTVGRPQGEIHPRVTLP